jgi:hypothetical protein
MMTSQLIKVGEILDTGTLREPLENLDRIGHCLVLSSLRGAFLKSTATQPD